MQRIGVRGIGLCPIHDTQKCAPGLTNCPTDRSQFGLHLRVLETLVRWDLLFAVIRLYDSGDVVSNHGREIEISLSKDMLLAFCQLPVLALLKVRIKLKKLD